MIKIGNIKIDIGREPLIIPEMGINHSGKIDIAFKIIDAAKKAGAKIIKNQTHVLEDEYSLEAEKIIPDNANKSIIKVIDECTFTDEEEYKIKRYCESKGMEYLSTPFSKKAVDRLEKLKVKCYKIGSGEFNNLPLVEYICKKNKPMILSTGMNNYKSIARTVKILNKYKINFALNHCTNVYPADYKIARLNCINELRIKYPEIPIGLSDHSENNLVALASVSLGVSLIERHFVDKKTRKGPDISSSMDGKQLKILIEDSKKIYLSLQGDKKILRKEKNVAKFAFASVVAIKDINKNEILNKNNIWVMRPGNGDFKANDYYKLLGKKAKRNIKKKYQVKRSDI